MGKMLNAPLNEQAFVMIEAYEQNNAEAREELRQEAEAVILQAARFGSRISHLLIKPNQLQLVSWLRSTLQLEGVRIRQRDCNLSFTVVPNRPDNQEEWYANENHNF